ncbi:MAG: ATP-binding cassette domain-containing protein, partial [Thermotogae bacterium]|nr:ATP-binding cassette domain-containing protein [Thermotogota bacterium]
SIDSLPLDQWRAYFSYVPQLPYLFSGSIRDNLVAVNPNIGEEEIGKVIDSANAAEFIQELDQGVDSELLEGGLNLSGGQRQRVVLSRAFLEDAPILLLDEATSALDTESERAVQEALSRLSEGRTTLVIAHRLSTVRKADVLFFLEAGAIVESGSHQELMKIPNGKYRQMVEAGILKNDSE